MNSYHDHELDDVLQDDELRRLAAVLSTARRPEPPVDDAFRTGLRRQLMQEAWAISEGRECARKVDEYLIGASLLERKDQSLIAL